MNKRIKPFLLFTLLMFLPGLSWSNSLTFEQALRHIWETHPEIKQAEVLLKSTGYDINSAHSNFLPYAQIQMAQGKNENDNVARLILPLWRGGRTLATIDYAEATQIAAAADLQKARLNLATRLVDAYFSVLTARDQAEQWKEYLAILEKLNGYISRRADAGITPESDVKNILSRIRQAEAESAMNEALRLASTAQFIALVNTNAEPKDWPSDSKLLKNSFVDKPAKDLSVHPEIAAALARISIEKASAKQQRSQIYPEISLRHSKPFGDAAENSDDNTQLYLEYQTDSGYRSLQSYKAGLEKVDAAREAVEATERQVYAAIAVARSEYISAQAQIEYQALAITAADEVVQSSIRQFEAGRRTWIEVLNAQREAHQAKLTAVQQRRSLWQANIRLSLQHLYWDQLLQSPTSN